MAGDLLHHARLPPHQCSHPEAVLPWPLAQLALDQRSDDHQAGHGDSGERSELRERAQPECGGTRGGHGGHGEQAQRRRQGEDLGDPQDRRHDDPDNRVHASDLEPAARRDGGKWFDRAHPAALLRGGCLRRRPVFPARLTSSIPAS